MADKQLEQDEIYFEFAADFKMLRLLRDSTANLLSKLGFSSEAINNTLLIINEAFADIIEYSYDFDRTKIIIVKVLITDAGVEFVFRDFGRVNEILQRLEKNRGTIQSDTKDISLIEKLADDYFIKKVDKGNELHIIKNK